MNGAIVVGCDQYEDPEIARLAYAAEDARAFAQILLESCDVADESLAVIPRSTPAVNASRNAVIRALTPRPDAERRRNLDTLFFFFSGHGFHSERDGRDYLVPIDAVAGCLEETALPFEAVFGLLRRWRARTTVLFLDVCRAALWGGKGVGSEPLPVRTDSAMQSGFATFWSCSPGQKSYEADAVKAGLFTSALVKGLGTDGRCRTVYELGKFLQNSVPELCKEHSKPLQVPYLIVEPLNIQDRVIVSERTAHRWGMDAPIGREIRGEPIPRWEGDAPGTSILCGFDFGTSVSAVAIGTKDGNVHFVPCAPNKTMVPSVVSFLPNLDYFVGAKALEHALLNPNASVFHVKRCLGTDTRFHIFGRSFSPEEIASLIIHSMAKNAEEHLGVPIDQALVSAPARFTINQCNAILKAFELAGLKVMRLVPEPSAAGLVAGLAVQEVFEEALVVVLDLGGGTLDISLIEIGLGVWEVRASGGDRTLGGVDWDSALTKYLTQRVAADYPTAKLTAADVTQLRSEAERAKILLAYAEAVDVVIRDVETPGTGLENLRVRVTREDFRRACKELDERVRQSLLSVFADGAMKLTDATAVVLAGQGTKIFTVRELIDDSFPGVPMETRYQENAVSMGMGRYTHTLNGHPLGVLLLDAFPTTLGIKCCEQGIDVEKEGYNCRISADSAKNIHTEVLVGKDSTIPTRRLILAECADGAPGGRLELAFVEVETGMQTGEHLLTKVDLEISERRRGQLAVYCDIDANRTVIVSGGFGYQFRVTNLFLALGNPEESDGRAVYLVQLPKAIGVRCASNGAGLPISRDRHANGHVHTVSVWDGTTYGQRAASDHVVMRGDGPCTIELVDLTPGRAESQITEISIDLPNVQTTARIGIAWRPRHAKGEDIWVVVSWQIGERQFELHLTKAVRQAEATAPLVPQT